MARLLKLQPVQPDLFPMAPPVAPPVAGPDGGACPQMSLPIQTPISPQMSRRYWIGVAAADHVRRGRAAGFMQLCHGKRAPLARLQSGDGILYYSPTGQFAGKDALQAFTAIGFVKPGAPYLFDMGNGFVPFRRDVDWLEPARITPIRPLLGALAFSRDNKNWGYQLRFGLFEISQTDFTCVCQAMRPEEALPFSEPALSA